MRSRLKEADARWLARFAVQVWRESVANGHFAAFFAPDVVLVPVPASRPRERAPWVGERLAWCLRDLGLADTVWPCLRRRYPVRKSAFAAAGERPSLLEHYASFAVDLAETNPDSTAGGRQTPLPDSPARGRAGRSPGTRLAPRLVLVDDVVTRGRTLLAAAARLREAFPGSEIRAFALMRTLGRGEVPWRNPDPCEGEVRWRLGDARRTP